MGSFLIGHSSAPGSLHSSPVNYVGLSALIVRVGYAEMSVNKIVIKRYAFVILSLVLCTESHDSRNVRINVVAAK